MWDNKTLHSEAQLGSPGGSQGWLCFSFKWLSDWLTDSVKSLKCQHKYFSSRTKYSTFFGAVNGAFTVNVHDKTFSSCVLLCVASFLSMLSNKTIKHWVY